MSDGDLNLEDETEAVIDDVTAKEQIYLLIAAVKASVEQEINYFKARTGYSISMIVRGIAAFIISILFILVAFMSLGVGILFILQPVIGIAFATLLTVVIFLTLSITMALFGRSYFRKLSFPELSKDDLMIEEMSDE